MNMAMIVVHRKDRAALVRSGTAIRQKLSHPQKQFTLDIGHLPAGVYHIELYPGENAGRVFYGVQVVLSY
ncbi:MAG: hypothetical protein EA411_03855 [Saprospirales bacterium]|nr:MAG: hypothetical protein EA411_03855 [Saprospirales bacterium]